MCKASAVSKQVSSRCSSCSSLLLTAGLWPAFTGLLPQYVALTVFSFLTLSRELLHIGGFSKNIHFPLVLTSRYSKTVCQDRLHVIKSGVGRLEEAAWQLNSPLRAGSLLPGGQDIVCLGRTPFYSGK